jgi:hypothetical protein
MSSAYEEYNENPDMLSADRKHALRYNAMLEAILPNISDSGAGISYEELLANPDLMHLLIEGSHEHPIVGEPDITGTWRRSRDFIADCLQNNQGLMSILDVGSSNGLLLKTVIKDELTIPFGVDKSELEISVARRLFPKYARNFGVANVFSDEIKAPHNISCYFPDEFDVIYWALWSREGSFTDEDSRMRKLLGKLALWTAERGQTLLGFYDTPRDSEHKRDLEEIGITPVRTFQSDSGVESVWELCPADVLQTLGFEIKPCPIPDILATSGGLRQQVLAMTRQGDAEELPWQLQLLTDLATGQRPVWEDALR